MSRSRAKTKAMKAGGRRQSDKKDKSLANRRFRRIARKKLGTSDENLPTSTKEVSDTWNFSSDGLASYDKDLKDKWMRK